MCCEHSPFTMHAQNYPAGRGACASPVQSNRKPWIAHEIVRNYIARHDGGHYRHKCNNKLKSCWNAIIIYTRELDASPNPIHLHSSLNPHTSIRLCHLPTTRCKGERIIEHGVMGQQLQAPSYSHYVISINKLSMNVRVEVQLFEHRTQCIWTTAEHVTADGDSNRN